MAAAHAPTVAEWLLRTFGSGSSIDALLGDLTEEYQHGRSAGWFWRQALTGIAVSFICEVRARPVIAIRAVLTGLLMFQLLWLAFGPLVSFLTASIKAHTPGWLYMQWQLYSLVSAACSFAAAILAGWTVARLHLRHRTMAVVGLLAVVVPPTLFDDRLYFLINNTLTHERYLPYLAVHLLHNGGTVAGLLIGGLALSQRTATDRAVSD